MVDKETAEIGLDALSAAIGEIPEHSRTATVMQPADGANRFLRIVHLQSTGQDVAAPPTHWRPLCPLRGA